MTDDFDPRFQRPKLSEADVRSALAALADRTGILHPDRAEWMIAGIIEGDWNNMGSGPTITAWKNHDDLLTVEEKRERGINTRVKICRALADTLTEKGLSDVNEALTAIFMAPIFARSRANPGATVASEAAGTTSVLQDYRSSQPQRLSAVLDARTCAVAKAAHGTVYPPGEPPDLPLPGCDALNCRCMFTSWSPYMEKRLQERTAGRAIDATPAPTSIAPEPPVTAPRPPPPPPAVEAPAPIGILGRLKRLFS